MFRRSLRNFSSQNFANCRGSQQIFTTAPAKSGLAASVSCSPSPSSSSSSNESWGAWTSLNNEDTASSDRNTINRSASHPSITAEKRSHQSASRPPSNASSCGGWTDLNAAAKSPSPPLASAVPSKANAAAAKRKETSHDERTQARRPDSHHPNTSRGGNGFGVGNAEALYGAAYGQPITQTARDGQTQVTFTRQPAGVAPVRHHPHPTAFQGGRGGGGHSFGNVPYRGSKHDQGQTDTTTDPNRRTGVCTKWLDEKGFGFIQCDRTKEIFFCHYQHLVFELITGDRKIFKPFRGLNVGHRVSFSTIGTSKNGQATNVCGVDGSALPQFEGTIPPKGSGLVKGGRTVAYPTHMS